MTLQRSIHPLPGEHERESRLLQIIDAFTGRKVAVVGDLIADEFIYGQIARVSREAPVLILKYDSTEIVPGGAGNAANNVAALGGIARPVGLVGRDEAGSRLAASFHARVKARGLLRPPGYVTPRKTRILAGGIHSAKQQVVRIDREASPAMDGVLRAEVTRRAVEALDGCDAVLLSDYGAGLLTPALVGKVQQVVGRSTRRRQVPILLDSRYDLLRYRGLTTCTPNEAEVEGLIGIRIGDDLDALERAGRLILKRSGMEAVLVTRGGRGMALFEHGRPTCQIPIFGSDEIADVTGAGDTVIATMALSLAAGASFYEAAMLANYAGGLVVMKRGTATVTAEELAEAVRIDHERIRS